MDEKLDVYELYVSRAMDFFGVGKVRSIYESAVELELPDFQTKVLCTRYARLERKLGEIDRARGLYIHASQFANPQQDAEFWEEWNRFEVRHGNEDTFREMLRIKRSVTASFSQMHFNMTTIELPSDAGTVEAGGMGAVEATAAASAGRGRKGASQLEDSMTALEEGAAAANNNGPNVSGFVRGTTEGGDVGGGAVAAADNPDEIDIGDDSDEEDDEDVGGAGGGGGAGGTEEIDVEQAAVPEGVFGGMKRAAEDAAEDGGRNEPRGALDRFKKARTGD